MIMCTKIQRATMPLNNSGHVVRPPHGGDGIILLVCHLPLRFKGKFLPGVNVFARCAYTV